MRLKKAHKKRKRRQNPWPKLIGKYKGEAEDFEKSVKASRERIDRLYEASRRDAGEVE